MVQTSFVAALAALASLGSATAIPAAPSAEAASSDREIHILLYKDYNCTKFNQVQFISVNGVTNDPDGVGEVGTAPYITTNSIQFVPNRGVDIPNGALNVWYRNRSVPPVYQIPATVKNAGVCYSNPSKTKTFRNFGPSRLD